MSKKKQPVTIGDFHRMLVLASKAAYVMGYALGDQDWAVMTVNWDER